MSSRTDKLTVISAVVLAFYFAFALSPDISG